MGATSIVTTNRRQSWVVHTLRYRFIRSVTRINVFNGSTTTLTIRITRARQNTGKSRSTEATWFYQSHVDWMRSHRLCLLIFTTSAKYLVKNSKLQINTALPLLVFFRVPLLVFAINYLSSDNLIGFNMIILKMWTKVSRLH